MIKINNRLQKISDFIFSDDSVIDIGCDHGLLGIYLYLTKKVKVISSDINQEPLNKAIENIKKYNLEGIIETRLGNGIEVLSNDINTIIISGMGGDTIIKILEKIQNYPYIKKLIISPNTDFSKTRKAINKLGFNLDSEIMIEENNKYYLVSCYKKEKVKKINYNFGKLDLSNKVNCKYFQNVITKNKKIINKLSNKYLFRKIKLIILNKYIMRKISKFIV